MRTGDGTAFAVVEGVVESGKRFTPALNAGIILANLDDVLKEFVVGVYAELG